MLSPVEQARALVQEMREKAQQELEMADRIDRDLDEGNDLLIMDGDDVVGFVFPKEDDNALAHPAT